MSARSSLHLLAEQRSHILLVLSNSAQALGAEFQSWLLCEAARWRTMESVLQARCFEAHELDITEGRCSPLPFRFLSIIDVSIDGAEGAAPLIRAIQTAHVRAPAASECATWLYHPCSEQVGRKDVRSSFITIAFANPTAGQEHAFREWYSTRHIRHALNVEPLLNGQCFERTIYQNPGVAPADYELIACYEHLEHPRRIVESVRSIDLSKLDFPTLDTSRFTEWCYRPLVLSG